MMTMREYPIQDMPGLTSVVWETKKQKDILNNLDEALENAKIFGWSYIFENDSYYIEYNDGTFYCVGEFTEDGIYKKKGIKKIIYTNCNDTWVYGDYAVNEHGIVS